MNLATAGIVSAAALIGGWGWFSQWQEDSRLEQERDSGSIKANRGSMPSDPKIGVESKPIGDNVAASDIWGRSLQHGFRAEASTPVAPPKLPIVEAVVPVVPPPPATTDLGLRLVGTVLEEGRSMAIAIDGLGTLDFRGEGDLLRLQPDGVRIDKVSRESVLVSYQGQSSTWQMGQSLQFQNALSPGVQLPIPPTNNNAVVNDPFEQPKPEIATQMTVPSTDPTVLPPEQTPSVMPSSTEALPKMSIEDELDMLNSPKPLDPF